MQKNVLVVDSYNILFKAFFVYKDFVYNGNPVGALYGFTSKICDLLTRLSPTHAICVFDSAEKSFRKQMYSEYKAHRPPVDEALKVQLAAAREIPRVFGIHGIERPGYEADDIIASIARSMHKMEDTIVTIITSDKDLFQLLKYDNVRVYTPKYEYITHEVVLESFGVAPKNIVDLLALTGDAADNIPGVPQIGPKKAARLINEFGNLHDIIASIDKISNPRIKQTMSENVDSALLSYKLATLFEDLDIADEVLAREKVPVEQLESMIKKYNFTSLLSKFEKLIQQEAEEWQLQY